MQYRPLGRTGLQVSLLCLGTMTWGQQNTEAEGHAQMDLALDHGINFFDTAELYSIPPTRETQGSTERIIGSWFKARRNRDRIILATKVVGRTPMDWFREHGGGARLDRANMTEALNKSLKRLGTDYIDLYQLHWPERAVPWGSNPVIWRQKDYQAAADENPIAEILDVLQEFVREGKVRHIGLSNESAWGTMRFLADAQAGERPRVQSVQNAYNLINRTYETALAEVSMRENVSLLAYSPLAQGFLTGKYLNGARPEGTRVTLFNRGQRYQTPGAEAAITAYVELAREFGLDPAQMALAYVNSRPFVGSNIIGATSLDQLRTDIGSLDIEITAELEDRIDAIHLRHTNPCP
jgi:aryl-alcohol dehydrogenase-like predicted oxidoreductase